ncbi:MAG: beta-ketoacyl synthase N-terminal-like domain-containing protein, partial [Kangiellaceae bacterium]|nr:beta-ketoacyl synthase N-terminal-like domain-containing protein [Kangiellaceae bacterium]
HVLKVKPMPSGEGLTALKQIIGSDEPQLLVLFGNKKAITKKFDKSHSSAKKTIESKPNKIASNSANPDKLLRAISQEVKMQTAEHLKRRPNELDDSADWAEFGFDSILLASFVNRFNSRFGLNLMPTVFFEATNIQLFAQYLSENHAQQLAKKMSLATEKNATQPVSSAKENSKAQHHDKHQNKQKISSFAQSLKQNFKAATTYRDKDIAIVGMSCKIAGTSSLEEFWEMLDKGKDMITEIPNDRWDWQDYPESRKWGSFIEGVREFDPLFVGISPAEAIYINPEQRLIMQYIWACVEDAGCGGKDVRGTDTGIFVGCGASAYTSVLQKHMPVEAYTATGEVTSVGPNRMSYLMDWHGPSNPIETACSSALVAVHRAVEAIRSGNCEQAIAGGVNLLLTPHAYISFSKAGMLAEDGRCKTFSDKANGYVRGEGVGMVMLKPLKQALQDGNFIYALVKGTAENHGGRTNSLTAPNPKSQSAVIKKAIKDAGVDFSRVGYVECHGTGTELGDPVEIKGLKTVASDLLNSDSQPLTCMLGSIKSNIGHLEFAAGIAGLIKVVLQMKNKKIAKSLHCESINPYIDLKDTHFKIAQEATDWEVAEGQTRVAGVSSFGFGGVNAHVVLEEYQQNSELFAREKQVEAQSLSGDKSQLVVISARNKEALTSYVKRFRDSLGQYQDTPEELKRIAYTLQNGRTEMQERLVFVVNSIADWSSQIDDYLESNGKIFDRRIYRGTVSTSVQGNIEIGDTESGKNYIKNLIESSELEKIAELWVNGTKIDWRLIHA